MTHREFWKTMTWRDKLVVGAIFAVSAVIWSGLVRVMLWAAHLLFG